MSAVKFFIFAVLVIVVFLAVAPAGWAQCAMCKASLTGSNNAVFIRNLNIGVLVLLVPPVTIFCSIFVVLKRRNKEGSGDDV
jgi:hypothetical protein